MIKYMNYNINRSIDISFENIWKLSIDKDRKTNTY